MKLLWIDALLLALAGCQPAAAGDDPDGGRARRLGRKNVFSPGKVRSASSEDDASGEDAPHRSYELWASDQSNSYHPPKCSRFVGVHPAGSCAETVQSL